MTEIKPTETKSHLDGVQNIYRFDNGYGASVIRNNFSYGGSEGLWELAVLDFTKDGAITYETPITDDVIGYLTDEDVQATLADIRALTRNEAA
jgi:hypothetical protein